MSSSCCSSRADTESTKAKSCCGGDGRGGEKRSIDWLLWVSFLLMVIGYMAHLFGHDILIDQLAQFSHGVYELVNKMWWGLGLGVLAVGVLSWVPREWVAAVLGKPGSVAGIFRAMSAGLILDLCNHGILLVAVKLYERGASYGQMLAFLIASPWNSLSLTLILVALIGLKWTLVFIVCSGVVAVVTGLIVENLVKAGRLPANPHQVVLPDGFHLGREMRARFAGLRFNTASAGKVLVASLRESRMVLRWIFFGTVLAAAIRALLPAEFFGAWFGPTWIGILLTLLAATVIEVCSEGSSPIAADLVIRANAPGNGFAFLMAGASTDYTEMMALKEATRSWRMAFVLPLLTLPQVVLIAWALNFWASSV